MFNLPIVQRELLIASRGLGSWLSRWILAMIAVSLGGFWLLVGSSVGQNAPGSLQGDVFFYGYDLVLFFILPIGWFVDYYRHAN